MISISLETLVIHGPYIKIKGVYIRMYLPLGFLDPVFYFQSFYSNFGSAI